ncbi:MULTISPECIES: heme ABC exporter ATP-binding protein CcmA [unclassified Nitrobacter]|uniref:heme ABC exporter ATP-binding protein CcmA n=1 Tax=unclassified Nitrobacter TaxID=2620411 RepID=UPI00092920FC|nr:MULTISPECIES: heme ABC exporter ATP-binding protein CcmA [unclassified Nitrobacter]MBN9148911.1 heme ABC exporter ATP-binding protein CcmA [Nitrobacter sp.]OJV03376.1 MAG: heme ABC exporter, ATP-binding protein CcmA [Nitrobacter sp. 62-23]
MKLSGRGLRCVRGGREVFSGLDVMAESGHAVAITGPNGAGKTSLLRLLAGLLAMAGGSISLEGGDPELTLPEQAHYLGHRDALKPALSVSENLSFWREFLGSASRSSPADAAQALATVGLDHVGHLPAAYLSAGQRRRLSIARLLAVKRPVWLLDEPTSALDVSGQSAFAAVMTEHLKGGGIILAATHTPLGIAVRELRIGGTA